MSTVRGEKKTDVKLVIMTNVAGRRKLGWDLLVLERVTVFQGEVIYTRKLLWCFLSQSLEPLPPPPPPPPIKTPGSAPVSRVEVCRLLGRVTELWGEVSRPPIKNSWIRSCKSLITNALSLHVKFCSVKISVTHLFISTLIVRDIKQIYNQINWST